jgi:acyl homoserine lactone synthase
MAISYYKSLENDLFLSIGKGDLQDTGNLTYKGLWNIKKLSDQLNHSDYRKYKKRCYLQRKSALYQMEL